MAEYNSTLNIDNFLKKKEGGFFQIREPGKKDWYNPKRDLVNAFPDWVREAVNRLPEMQGEEQAKGVLEVCKSLAAVIRKIRSREFRPDEEGAKTLEKELNELLSKNSEALATMGLAFLIQMIYEYWFSVPEVTHHIPTPPMPSKNKTIEFTKPDGKEE